MMNLLLESNGAQYGRCGFHGALLLADASTPRLVIECFDTMTYCNI